MAGDDSDGDRSGIAVVARAIGHGIWVLIPLISMGFLAWVPAVQTYWRARSAGWLITSVALLTVSVAIVVGIGADIDSGLLGSLLIGGSFAGVVAGALGRPIAFAAETQPRVDPAVEEVLANRERRRAAHEIVENDPAMAIELGIGRRPAAGGYNDGGLVDLNSADASYIVSMLHWPEDVAAAFVADREARGGYSAVAEAAALSAVNPAYFEPVADQVVVLSYQRRA